MTRNLRVIDIWSHVDPSFGGVGPAASQLSEAVSRVNGWTTRLAAICDPNETRLADGIPPSVNKITIHAPRPVADIRIRRGLRGLLSQCDVCHLHGLWLPHTLAARQIARQLGKPIVSSVHGMLEKWELANKGLKKRVYSWLFERSSLAQSACLRALSSQEADDYRKYGLTNPIAIIPNGIGSQNGADPEMLVSRFPQLRNKSIVVFLGRVHYKKGILNLIEAWREVARTHAGAHLLVAGPDYEATLQQAKSMMEEFGLCNSVTFAGTLAGDMKRAAFSAARYFCLPSYSEGLSVAGLEALSAGVPVIVTAACNIDGVEEYGAGHITFNDPPRLGAVLSRALSLGEAEWRAMSAQASRLARERYDWASIAQTMGAVYSWILGGPKPGCVID